MQALALRRLYSPGAGGTGGCLPGNRAALIAACPANPAASHGPRRAAPLPLVLDSSCWLEHFADSDRAALFAPVMANAAALIVKVAGMAPRSRKDWCDDSLRRYPDLDHAV